MRSFIIFSIGLGILLVSLMAYVTLYIDEFGGLVSNSYWNFVDRSLRFAPSDIPPFLDYVDLFASDGIPVYPGSFKVSVVNGSEVYIYDVDELYVVEAEALLDLKDYAYRVGVVTGEAVVEVHIERVDRLTPALLISFFIIGVILCVWGYGWRRK